MIEIRLSRITDFLHVEAVWRELESRSDASFFQSWAWTGCLAAERYSNPILLTARDGFRVVALGMLNSSPSASSLWLGETGNPSYDSIFIEHNGFLIERGRPDLVTSCLEAARTSGTGYSAKSRQRRLVVLSGVSDEYLMATRESNTAIRVRATHQAPFIDLDDLRRSNREPLSVLSPNTRYQIRRSEREYARTGPLSIQRARSEQEAHDFLTALSHFHQASWSRRGRRGAFSNPQFERFHRALINRAFPTRGTDLLRVNAGTKVVGYLYNLLFQGRVFAYQSGFDYEVSDPHQKPGLTCHHLAIEMYLAEGARVYDFLAGANRYKTSFATNTVRLHWLEYGQQPIWRAFRWKLCSLKEFIQPGAPDNSSLSS